MLRRSALMLMVGVAALAVGGCTSQHASVKKLSLADAVAAHKGGAVFVDANGEDFRRANGKVPGAILLANYRLYDPKSVLPQTQDTPLVFYCTNKL